MIEIDRREEKNFNKLPPALQDTIRRKWKCSCDGNEYDKIIIIGKLTDIYLICRKCGLIKKYYEGIKEAL